MKRIHIVGAPGCGMEVLHLLMVSCFAIDAHERGSTPLNRKATARAHVLCTHCAGEEHQAPALLTMDQGLHFIYFLRDPRDAVVCPDHDTHWPDLDTALASMALARRYKDHPRFHVIRYEDLLKDPAGVQARLAAHMDFLAETRLFSEFDLVAQTHDQGARPEGHLRPLVKEGIGCWVHNKSALGLQLDRAGDITPVLTSFNYEKSSGWLNQIKGAPTPGTEGTRKLRKLTTNYTAAFAYLFKRWGGELKNLILRPETPKPVPSHAKRKPPKS